MIRRLLFRPWVRAFDRRVRWVRKALSAQRAPLLGLALTGALVLALTGERAAYLDSFGRRADLLAAVALGAAALILRAAFRRVYVPLISRRTATEEYDERHLLFDLGQAARAATDIDDLYRLIVSRVEEALGVEGVSLFIQQGAAGDYVCQVTTTGRPVTPAGSGGDGEETPPPFALARAAFVVKRLRNLSVPLGLEAGELETWERALATAPELTRSARRRECETLRRLKARLLLQVTMKDQLIGVLALGARRSGQRFTPADKRMLMSVASQTAFIIENAKLVERMVEEDRLRRDLKLASDVQQKLFPARAPQSLFCELAGFCQPAREIGGDYYDFLTFEGGQIGVAIADVAGKGISAALLMSSVQASLRSQAAAQQPAAGPEAEGAVSRLVASLNRLMCQTTGAASYVTFFYAQFDERTQRLTYVNAGHNPPFLVRAEDDEAAVRDARQILGAEGERARTAGSATGLLERVEATRPPICLPLTTGGPVIGVFADCPYREEVVQLRSGDLLFAYTDGVTEALSREGIEFGEVRLQEMLSRLAGHSAEEVRALVVRALREWCEGAPQHDDLTFVVFKAR